MRETAFLLSYQSESSQNNSRFELSFAFHISKIVSYNLDFRRVDG